MWRGRPRPRCLSEGRSSRQWRARVPAPPGTVRTLTGAKSIMLHVPTCEPWAAMLASNNVASLGFTRSRAWLAREVFGTAAPRAGGAETGRRTGAKEFKSRRAKRLGWRLRERLSLRAPHCLLVSWLFRFCTRRSRGATSAPHSAVYARPSVAPEIGSSDE